MKLFAFGEIVPGYSVPVLNEREVRAGAGILFVSAFAAFMNALLVGNLFYLKIFIIAFWVDFFIRLVVNPKYSPVLIMGRFIVRHQSVEYSGAPQKRFAWTLGLIMASLMFFLVIIVGAVGPLNLFMCLLCLTLLFFETSFGICLGCKLYNMFHAEKAQLCPGGACEIKRIEPIQQVSLLQVILVVLFIIFLMLVALGQMNL